ncbi:SHC-transforming protein 1 isoform X2 [Pseudomyrmex gracilis]|uniref:SHC-transforming protein 1 isoform X2 n=1 Tax=Pseudomyrmex gracilis TaxID=219809 RepID=UPI000994D527|nr:SHC-transforming protein 1 isoform X2 [Pseudomyrmex gracilis]
MSRCINETMATGSSSFISKPPRGWLHPDHLVSTEGITYTVKYIGCLEVYTSMKSLDFETRSCVAKECINRVCEAAGLKSADKKRRVDRKVLRAIADKPRMEHTTATVNLTISSCSLSLTNIETGHIIAKHDMPRISFASGGDTEILDFVAYVAKNMQEWRACYVLECTNGLAQDVISTIGQAFELRFKEFLTKPSSFLHPGLNGAREIDRDYYNDLPGKVPPDIGPPPVPPLPTIASTLPNLKHHQNHASTRTQREKENNDLFSPETQQLAETGNLIDLNSDDAISSSTNVNITSEHNYVNDSVIAANRDNHRDPTSFFDVFDMQPFSSAISDMSRLSPHSQKQQLEQEIWFHGSVSRSEAESMLTRDGDFLVRESHGSPDQYVLTGMHNGTAKHLLLIDPEGVVRTKDRVFDSVSHLVNHHCDNVLPIISADSVLVLRHPIPRDINY